MRLTKLKLRNFKSFKSAVIEFPSDLIAITGPNGSGKSNIMEAILFAMGARGSWLRSSGLRGLIRKGADSCSVELVFESDGKALRLERRVSKSGSTYRLNGKLAQASEVRDALADLGLRAEGYNFVGQGEVTAVIESTPRERAEILLEISGVQEFEEKRAATLRELEKVEEKLEVARVLLKEREERVERLRAKAEAYAERARLESRLTSLEKTLLMRRLEEVQSRLSELSPPTPPSLSESQVQELQREIKAAESRLRELESSGDLKLAREASMLEIRLSTLKEREKSIESELESLRSLLATIGVEKPPRIVTNHPSFVGVVGELLHPLEGYELAYRAIAGGRLGDIVIETLEAGLEILKSLRRENLRRRMRILPLDILKPPPRIEPPSYSLGLLRDFVRADPEYQDLVGVVVGNAVLVEDLADVPKSDVGRFRFVSLEGEVLERDGSLVSRPPSPAQERRLRDRLSKLVEERQRVQEKIRDFEERLKALPPPDRAQEVEEALAKVRKRINELREILERALAERLAYERRMRAIAEERGRLLERLDELKARLEELADVEPADSEDPELEYASLSAKLRTLPVVGPQVLDELKREEERLEEMSRTLDELEEARRSILKALDELMAERDRVITETAEKISHAFHEAVREMLGGGGSVRLVGSWPKLELLVEVNLPDKGEVPMESLSGGEKSLAALAFIYALQSVRPSPLYFFDEADMMLDGRNCKRYAALLKKMVARGAQVIIISLKKDTLEEADAILGVRMLNGESKIVGVKLDEFPRSEAQG